MYTYDRKGVYRINGMRNITVYIISFTPTN